MPQPFDADQDGNCNIAVRFDHSAGQQPEQPALIVGRNGRYRTWTFRDLQEVTGNFAYLLNHKGIERGDRVILMVGPSVEFVALAFALFKVGAVVILIDPGMGFANLRRCIAQVAPQVFIGSYKGLLFKTLCPKVSWPVRFWGCSRGHSPPVG
jgi:acyl-coenzyme A synthetase/AMP-(fatty) acid ligase